MSCHPDDEQVAQLFVFPGIYCPQRRRAIPPHPAPPGPMGTAIKFFDRAGTSKRSAFLHTTAAPKTFPSTESFCDQTGNKSAPFSAIKIARIGFVHRK